MNVFYILLDDYAFETFRCFGLKGFTFTSGLYIDLSTRSTGVSFLSSLYSRRSRERYREHKADRELRAHVHPSGFARPVLQKNDLAKLKIAVFSVCSVTLRLRVKKRTLCLIKTLNLTKKCFKTKTQARRPLIAVALKSLIQWKIIKLFPPKVVAVA